MHWCQELYLYISNYNHNYNQKMTDDDRFQKSRIYYNEPHMWPTARHLQFIFFNHFKQTAQLQRFSRCQRGLCSAPGCHIISSPPPPKSAVVSNHTEHLQIPPTPPKQKQKKLWMLYMIQRVWHKQPMNEVAAQSHTTYISTHTLWLYGAQTCTLWASPACMWSCE